MRRFLLCCLISFAGCGDDTRPADDAAAPPAADPRAPEPGTGPRGPSLDPVLTTWLARVDSSVFTRWGACPFECCVYRDWVAEAPVVVRAQPDSAARVVATLASGERFEADTGFVRITSPQLVVVTSAVEAYRVAARPEGGVPDTLATGDTLLVLDYEGEGHYRLTDGEHVYSAAQFWPGADGWQPFGGPQGRTIGTHEAEWWAHVRARDAVEGWIDAYASELGNVDACGVPM